MQYPRLFIPNLLLGLSLLFLVSLPASAVVTDRVYFETLFCFRCVFSFDLLLLSYTLTRLWALSLYHVTICYFAPSCCTS